MINQNILFDKHLSLYSVEVKSTTKVLLYKYVAARLNNTILADKKSNLTAQLAMQANNKYFVSPVMSDGSKLTNLANGYFIRTDSRLTLTELFLPDPPTDPEEPAYFIDIYFIKQGSLTLIRAYSRITRKQVYDAFLRRKQDDLYNT